MFLSYEHEDARRFRLTQEPTDRFKNTRKSPVEDNKTCEAISSLQFENDANIDRYSPSNGQPVVFPLHYSWRQMLNEGPGP